MTRHGLTRAALLACLSAACLCAVAAAAAPTGAQRTYPPLLTGARKAGASDVQACACIDAGMNDQACFTGVTRYCQSNRPNMTLCAAMSAFCEHGLGAFGGRRCSPRRSQLSYTCRRLWDAV